MAVYNAIKYNHDFAGTAGNLFPLATTSISSGTANVTFNSGIDSTFKEYFFIWNNIHVSTNGESTFGFQGTTDGSNYNVSMNTTMIANYNNEANNSKGMIYYTGGDQANGTATQIFNSGGGGSDNDQCVCGWLHLFNPADTTHIKHFTSVSCNYQDSDYINFDRMTGYFNTTSAVTGIRFLPGRVYASTNLDDGVVQMFGVK